MNTKVFAAAATILALGASSAAAWEGKVVECYGKVWYPAEYSTSKVLVKHAKTKWEHRHGQMVKVHYAPVYKEVKTKTKDGHWIMRKEACAGS